MLESGTEQSDQPVVGLAFVVETGCISYPVGGPFVVETGYVDKRSIGPWRDEILQDSEQCLRSIRPDNSLLGVVESCRYYDLVFCLPYLHEVGIGLGRSETLGLSVI